MDEKTFESLDGSKKAVVNKKLGDDYYTVDFYHDDCLINSIEFPGKSRFYTEEAADNFVTGVFTIEDVMSA